MKLQHLIRPGFNIRLEMFIAPVKNNILYTNITANFIY